jgi:hypothetical protein
MDLKKTSNIMKFTKEQILSNPTIRKKDNEISKVDAVTSKLTLEEPFVNFTKPFQNYRLSIKPSFSIHLKFSKLIE